MAENSNNTNAGQETGDGHEFLPLDFSVNEHRTAEKKTAPVKLPLAAASRAAASMPAQQSPAPIKLPAAAAVKSTASQAQEEVPQKPAAAPAPAPVKLPVQEKVKSLDEVFPEDGEDSAGFPTPGKSKANDEINELKKKFEDTPKEAAVVRSPTLLKRGFPPVPPKPTPQPVKLVQPKTPVVLSGSISPENATPGQILQEVRAQSGLSIAQVEQTTKIKADYISSLERDDYPALPPMVYVNAYVKNLCSLYNIGLEDMEKMLKNIKKESTPIVSEEIIHHIEEDRQVNPEEGRKVQRLVFASIVVFIVFITTLAIGGVKIYKTYKKTNVPVSAQPASTAPTAAGQPAESVVVTATFNEKDLEKLIVPQTFSIDELSVPKKRGR